MISLLTAFIQFLHALLSARPLLTKSIKDNKFVADALKTILNDLSADRVYLCHFHNGGKYYTGKSQQKFSTTFEVVSEGIELGWQERNTPTTLWCYALNLCINNNFTWNDIDKIQDLATVARLKAKGVKSITWVPIMGKKDLLMFVGIDWVKDPAGTIDVPKLKARLDGLKSLI